MKLSNMWLGVLWCSIALASCDVTPEFLQALAQVESGNRDIPGDNGNAQGPFQIWEINVREANRILRAYVFSPDLRHDYDAAAEMTRVVLTYWERHFERKFKMELGVEDLAAIHRHGPSWSPEKTTKAAIDRDRGKAIQKYLAK